MKKLIAVPVVAVIAAVGAASAAGFAGGVSAAPLQVGQTNDLECASSAKVVEWGYDDGLNESKEFPSVVNARVELTKADCTGQAVSLIQIDDKGGQLGDYRATARVPQQTKSSAGSQFVRVVFNKPVPAEGLKAIRISVDQGTSQTVTGNAG